MFQSLNGLPNDYTDVAKAVQETPHCDPSKPPDPHTGRILLQSHNMKIPADFAIVLVVPRTNKPGRGMRISL